MKIVENVTAVLFFLGLASCSGFLEEQSKDMFIPTLPDHYSSLLLEEFNYNSTVFSGVQYMTDEVQEWTGKIEADDYRNDVKPMYAWQRELEVTEDGRLVTNNKTWGDGYRDIAIANYVIEQVEDANGSREEIDFVKGEAYFIRAYCYFCLTNLYAEPYRSATQAKVTQGIPLRTDIGVVPTYSRGMLDEGYRLMESDLGEARRLIEVSGLTKSIYHPTIKACDLLLSRVKLYQKEYEAVIETATRVIIGTTLKKLTRGNVEQVFINKENPELLYSFSQLDGGLSAGAMDNAGLVVNPELLGRYGENDLRKSLFFDVYTGDKKEEARVYTRKMTRKYTALGYCNFRVAEAYLNRAEAYAYLNRSQEAVADLQELLRNRYTDAEEIHIPTEREALIRFVYEERFKELCFEDHHRWFDLRRMEVELRPEIIHRFSIVDAQNNKLGTETYRLLRDDRNYTCPVPRKEKENNLMIRDYERFDKLPDYERESEF